MESIKILERPDTINVEKSCDKDLKKTAYVVYIFDNVAGDEFGANADSLSSDIRR
jgi:hypothetical protein